MACLNSGRERFGVGIDANIVTASVKALVSGINRLMMATAAVQQAA
jgi:2-isopropylmalate synthase